VVRTDRDPVIGNGRSLTDFLPKGNYEVWYFPSPSSTKPDWFFNASFAEHIGPTGEKRGLNGARFPTVKEVLRDYVLLGRVNGDGPIVSEPSVENVFYKMQAIQWASNGAREFIRGSGAGHTSMSIGDVIRTPNGAWLAVADEGFIPLVDGDMPPPAKR
jgi:hypothetical protein